jgi:hypothetical protein
MKKMLIGFLILAAGLAQAESVTVTLTATNSQTVYSDALPIHGILDKIEVVQSGVSTAAVSVATFSGTTAIETYCTATMAGASVKLIRPRFVGTGATGTALAAVVAGSSDALTNNVTTVLSVPYEAPMIGGNVKVRVVNAGTTTAINTVTIFYTPIKR